jgi:hypothetical protein
MTFLYRMEQENVDNCREVLGRRIGRDAITGSQKHSPLSYMALNAHEFSRCLVPGISSLVSRSTAHKMVAI